MSIDVLPSAHFAISELACPCCGLWRGIDPALVDGLEDLRHALGDKPIYVCRKSHHTGRMLARGVRCRARNTLAGGATHSRHMSKYAADVEVRHVDLLDVYQAVLAIPQFRGIGLYPPGDGNGTHGFIHVDTRAHSARWARVGGAYVPIDNAIRMLELARQQRAVEADHG